MKTNKLITNTYEELFSIENLYAAHLKSRASRRSKKPIVKFEISALGNIYELHKKLINGTFKFGGYNTFLVFEPKRREIQNMRYCDRVIQHVLCDNMLMPYFANRVIYDNCVCQKGKGNHFALDRFEKMLRRHIDKNGVNGYFLKCDVLKFFASIPHDKLKSVVCTRIVDEILELFAEYTRAYVFRLINKSKSVGELAQFSSGVYYIPQKADIGLPTITADDVINKKYVQNGNNVYGIYSGVKLQNEFSVTSQMPDVVEIVTSHGEMKCRKLRLAVVNLC